jgi:hypothetical protein
VQIPRQKESLNESEPLARNSGNGSCPTTGVDPHSHQITRKPTGPRSSLGKDRTKHNALKHGIFSQVVLLKNEPRSEFDSLLSRLRDDLQPEGMLEEILVEKLATLVWRHRRLIIAETAEIRKGVGFLE